MSELERKDIRMVKRFGRLLLPVGLLAAGVTWPATAMGGTYEVHQCRVPSGGRIGASDLLPVPTSDANLYLVNDCVTGGALTLGAGSANTSQYASIGYRFDAPTGTRIVRVRGARAYALGGLNGINFALYATRIFGDSYAAFSEACYQGGSCQSVGSISNPTNEGNSFDYGMDDHSFRLQLECGGGAGGLCTPGNGPAVARLYRVQFTLSDSLDPTAEQVSGPLVAPGTKSGTLAARFTASDQGGGVYRTLMKVDSVVVDADIVDDNGGACRDLVPGGDPYDGFTRAVPCELTSSASPTLDTTRVPDGWHKLSLEIEDAAGNRNVIFPPTSFLFDNRTTPGSAGGGAPGGPNGTNATSSARMTFEGRSAASRSVGFGKSINIVGRLMTPSGRAIEGAALDVMQQLRLAGAAARRVATVRTDARGYFKYVVPVGPSRTFDVGYRAVLAPTEADRSRIDYDVRQRVELSVAAGIRLKVAPRIAQNLDTLRFSGRLLGTPYPRRGKVVLLQAQVTRLRKVSWQTFLTARADRKGGFKGRYRLTRSIGAKGYRFRAVVPRGEDYPYATGASKPAGVKIVR